MSSAAPFGWWWWLTRCWIMRMGPAHWLATLRSLHGLSQKELAVKAGHPFSPTRGLGAARPGARFRRGEGSRHRPRLRPSPTLGLRFELSGLWTRTGTPMHLEHKGRWVLLHSDYEEGLVERLRSTPGGSCGIDQTKPG